MESIKTTGKEYYYAVSGLMIPKYMVHKDLSERLEFFVDWVPKNTEQLEKSAARNNDDFVQLMETLYILICDIHAGWLESEASKILRMVGIADHATLTKMLTPFIASARTLALDIQMAQTKGFESGYHQRGEIETYKDIISSVKILIVLINSGDFEKAFDMVTSINEFRENNTAVTLFANIAMKDAEKSLRIAEAIISDYSKRIDKIISEAIEASKIQSLVIVDDMPDTLTALSFMLKDHFRVFAFPDGKQALDFIDRKQQPNAFLLDIDMPDMNGFTLAKKIRSRKKTENTPIIFLTGNSRKDTFFNAMDYKPKAFIVKPANKDILISKLSSCL